MPMAPSACRDFENEVLPALKTGSQACHQGPGAVFSDGVQIASGDQCKTKRFWNHEGDTGFEFTKTLRKNTCYRITVEGRGWAGETPMYVAWVCLGKMKEDIPISFLYLPPDGSLKGVQRAFTDFGGYAD